MVNGLPHSRGYRALCDGEQRVWQRRSTDRRDSQTAARAASHPPRQKGHNQKSGLIQVRLLVDGQPLQVPTVDGVGRASLSAARASMHG